MREWFFIYLFTAILIVSFVGSRHLERPLDTSLNLPNNPPNTQTISPQHPQHPQTRSVSIHRQTSGFYEVQAYIDGYSVDMLIDTGARLVALTQDDAQRLNYDTQALPKDVQILTAGGRTLGSLVQLEEIQIGDVVVYGVEAVIMDESLSRSLLGMSFLKQVSQLELTPERIIIHQ